MDHLSLSLFGPFRISLNQRELVGITSHRGSILLAYLTLEGAHPHSRQKLANLFWPDAPPAAAKNSLRQTLYRLKTLFKKDGQFDQFFATNRQSIKFLPDASHWIDVKEYQQLLNARKSANLEFDARTQLIERMISLYQGEFLAGYSADSSAELDSWIHNRRVWFRDQTAEGLKLLVQSFQERGNIDMAQHYTDKLLNIDSLNEYAFQKKIELLVEKGQSAEAINQYTRFRARLQQHVGIEPNGVIQTLVRSVQIGQPRPQQPAVTPVQDNQPQQRQTSLSKPTLPALPQPHIPFLNNQLTNHLQPKVGSVLAIWGLPGIGKSVLANEVARQFSQRHYFNLSLQKSDQVLEWLAEASAATMSQHASIILDQVDRTPHLNHLIDQIFEKMPQVRVIVTSRLLKKLTWSQMTQFQLDGLDYSGAMSLLMQKAEATEAQVKTVATIVQKIGGHPAALLELTRWLQVFSWEMLAHKIKLGDFLWDETPLTDWFSTLRESLSENELTFLDKFRQATDSISADELIALPLNHARAAMRFVERGLLYKKPDGSLKLNPLFRLWIQHLQDSSFEKMTDSDFHPSHQTDWHPREQIHELDQTGFLQKQKKVGIEAQSHP